jgi:hypothetical protein
LVWGILSGSGMVAWFLRVRKTWAFDSSKPDSSQSAADQSSESPSYSIRYAAWRLLPTISAVALIAFFIVVPRFGDTLGTAVVQGTRLDFQYQSVGGFHLLDLPAIPSYVTSTTFPAVLLPSANHCVLFLGHSAGTYILYDRNTGETLRFADAAVLVKTGNQGNYRANCPLTQKSKQPGRR